MADAVARFFFAVRQGTEQLLAACPLLVCQGNRRTLRKASSKASTRGGLDSPLQASFK